MNLFAKIAALLAFSLTCEASEPSGNKMLTNEVFKCRSLGEKAVRVMMKLNGFDTKSVQIEKSLTTDVPNLTKEKYVVDTDGTSTAAVIVRNRVGNPRCAAKAVEYTTETF